MIDGRCSLVTYGTGICHYACKFFSFFSSSFFLSIPCVFVQSGIDRMVNDSQPVLALYSYVLF